MRIPLFVALLCIASPLLAADDDAKPVPLIPVPLIFDTDIGNDCDDVLALGMIHSLQTRGECELLAVTITKDHVACRAVHRRRQHVLWTR